MIESKINIKSHFYDLTESVNIENNIDDIVTQICSHDRQLINFYWLGKCSYNPIWKLQKKLHQLRIDKKINDIVLLLEHNHVYTLGKNADSNHILPSKPDNVEIVNIDRGGDVTYHGPGQLVGYPIFDLHNYKMSITWYIKLISDSLISLLDEFNIKAYYNDDYIGVWVEDEKIAALGIRLAKWVTMHGFALNINTDLNYFNGMIPCGIFEHGVTSINQINNEKLDVKEIAKIYSEHFLKKLSKEIN